MRANEMMLVSPPTLYWELDSSRPVCRLFFVRIYLIIYLIIYPSISLIRPASTSSGNGFDSTAIPASSCPLLSSAASA